MQSFPPTLIIRHRKENLKKCSLRGLECRSDFRFFSYPGFASNLPDLSNYILLSIDAPVLSLDDASYGLLVLDGTWRYAAKMERYLYSNNCKSWGFDSVKANFSNCSGADEADAKNQTAVRRSLPPCCRTVYPRIQKDCSDPERGLASVEAIFLCYHILGRSTEGLLDHYYWKDLFLEKNSLTF